MTDQGPTPSGEDAPDQAAEHVLGLLEGEARSRAAERARTDPAFRARVEAWERRLTPLADEVAPVSPPGGVWRRIAQSIEPKANVVPFPVRPRLWDRVGLWRAATAGSLAAAACLAVVAVRSPNPTAAPSPATSSGVLAATLATAGGKALFVATIDRSRDGVTVVPVAGFDSEGRYPELWIIPAGGKPRPVGMIQAARPLLLSSAALSSAHVKAVFAVSLEPPGGSPTGAPTGPVIATGAVTAL